MNQFRICSVTELRHKQWQSHAQILGLIALGWMAATLLSRADNSVQTPLNQAVAAGQFRKVTPAIDLDGCPQMSGSGLHMDCRLSIAPQS
jgi:hypothetical protein